MNLKDMVLGAITLVLVAVTLALGTHGFTSNRLPLLQPYAPEPPEGAGSISLSEARELLDDAGVVFIDAREREKYEAGHIPGAVHLPPEQAEAMQDRSLLSLTVARRIVVYCDGPHCGASRKLARRLLQARIMNIAIMPEGWPGWEQAGHPVVLPEEGS
ncbi:MAG: rhodanese-like domain-containing protein [Armatimonadetes bacterium]|nr:rhodanese-like domain-containing protein [Armatimonadota bacterium]